MTFAARPFTADDAWAFNAGRHATAYEVLGAHLDDRGVTFRVWAPDAITVDVIGDMNGWRPGTHRLEPDPSGVWRGHVPGATAGQRYKYRITPRAGPALDKADPFAFSGEEPPATASVICCPSRDWTDQAWMGDRGRRHTLDAPISIYEVHLGSWRFEPGGYTALGRQLAPYVADLGFTHVELLPVTEHPFYGSWGYQTTGYFSPTARYGSPQDLMEMIDVLHQHEIGVILDWVPAHFPDDQHGLARFDGTHLYEHADPRRGWHPDWDSLIFNYDRAEVRSFLLSSADFWFSHYHVDGLRVDAVASMLYLDYSRREGEWVPNVHGGRENTGAIAFLRDLNTTVYGRHPGIVMIAEESTAWPGVSRPADHDGLGFGLKWDMGWMHDTLSYLSRDPVHRRHHHDELTFRSIYATSENFVLPLSHDEVVHGKGSLLSKLPGDPWQQLANLRLLYGYQWALPGKKLLFMGGELAQPREWDHERELDWARLGEPGPAGVHRLVASLNRLYLNEPALYEGDCTDGGFEWLVADDAANSVLAFARYATEARPVIVVANFTPVVRHGYRVGVPRAGRWIEILTTDHDDFGGSGVRNPELTATPEPGHGHDQSLLFTLPPLAVVFAVPDQRD